MKLAALQAKFQDALLGRDAEREILAAIAPSPRLEPTARFEVYAQAYRLRLAGFLAEDFKVLNNALGDAGFHTLTHAYIAATPSRHRNARWYARDLPDFMQATAPWNESRSLVDIARLERALADAFDATDAPAASRAALAGLAPDAWPQIRLIFRRAQQCSPWRAGSLPPSRPRQPRRPARNRTKPKTSACWSGATAMRISPIES